MIRRILAAGATGAAALLLLTACATGSAVDPGATPDSGASADADVEIEVDAAWLDGGRMIGLITQGSSSCVPVASDASLAADGSLAVTLEEPAADTPCTRDMAPRVTLVDVPEGVDPSEDLQISVTGEGSHGDTDLAGVPGLAVSGETEYAPSAGWTDEDGQFVVLTWGSSVCPEVVEAAEVTGADAVTVTFAAHPADEVCTMDMAPRAVLAFADGLEDQPNVVLTLVGPDFPEVKTQILGENFVEIPLG